MKDVILEKIMKRTGSILTIMLLVFLVVSLSFSFVSAEDSGLPSDYQPSDEDNRDPSMDNIYGIPWHGMKNIFTSDRVQVGDIQTLSVPEDYDEYIDEPEGASGVSFRLYNSTTQETEAVLETDSSGILRMPDLKRGHTYVLSVDSSTYSLADEFFTSRHNNIYIWALASGDQGVADSGAYEHKLKYIRLNDDDPVPDNYLDPVSTIYLIGHDAAVIDDTITSRQTLPVKYNGADAPDGITFRFTSPDSGTVKAVTENGQISADFVEDTDYTVHVDDDNYTVSTFALSVKDKSEHKYKQMGTLMAEGKYCYDHTCCQRVYELTLADKSGADSSGSVKSLKKYGSTEDPQSTVTGMDFKTLLLLVRYPAVTLPAGSGIADHDTVELTLANPHRWEKCKITDTEFKVTQMLPQKRTVKAVYQLKDGKLEPLSFSQKNTASVIFKTDSMSLYPVVIEYADKEPEVKPVTPDSKTAGGSNSSATANKTTKVSKPSKTSIKKLKPGKKKITVIWKKKTKNVSGYQIQYGEKKSFKKAKKVTVKKAKTTRKTIKKLKARRRYYFRIRTYRKVKGKTYYSAWSKAKSVKTR